MQVMPTPSETTPVLRLLCAPMRHRLLCTPVLRLPMRRLPMCARAPPPCATDVLETARRTVARSARLKLSAGGGATGKQAAKQALEESNAAEERAEQMINRIKQVLISTAPLNPPPLYQVWWLSTLAVRIDPIDVWPTDLSCLVQWKPSLAITGLMEWTLGSRNPCWSGYQPYSLALNVNGVKPDCTRFL